MEPSWTCARILFSRVPVPGKVKTRLEPVLSTEQRSAFQEALIIDIAQKLFELGSTMMLCYLDEDTPADDGRYFDELYSHLRSISPDDGRYFDELYSHLRSIGPDDSRIIAYPQRGDELGKRMSNALADAFETGADACLLIGSDLPYIASSDIARTEQLLADADIVFGPSSDGGFWLVGMKEPFPELFEDERYSKDDVLARALALCAKHGKTVALAPFSSDVDTPDDYLLLVEHVKAGDPRIGKHTIQFVNESEDSPATHSPTEKMFTEC